MVHELVVDRDFAKNDDSRTTWEPKHVQAKQQATILSLLHRSIVLDAYHQKSTGKIKFTYTGALVDVKTHDADALVKSKIAEELESHLKEGWKFVDIRSAINEIREQDPDHANNMVEALANSFAETLDRPKKSVEYRKAWANLKKKIWPEQH